MGLFGFGKTSSPQAAVSKDIVVLYERLRLKRLRLNNELLARLSGDTIRDGAKRIGILRGGTIVFENEDETSVLMDYCIYEVYLNGRNAVGQYLRDCPPDPDSDEMICLHAMQNATYALVAVLSVERGVGCRVRNLFTDETRLLVDMGFSKTAKPGTVLATRLLDFGDWISTTGAALPLGVLDSDELDEWQQKFRMCLKDIHSDPAMLIRACLEKGASSNIRYEETGTHRRFDTRESFPPPKTTSRQRRALALRRSDKPASIRRCNCGSGKMFKNCCGKR